MEEILSGLINASSGGIFGGVMALASNYMKGREKDKQHKRDIEVHTLQIEADSKSYDRDIAVSRENASSATFLASYQDANSPNAPAWAAGGKAIFRPILTTFLIGLTAYILTLEDMSEALESISHTVIFLTGTAVCWWFGERSGMPSNSK